jgi:hypothetical protein
MGLIKRSGEAGWTQRNRKMHGSTAEWGMARSHGKLMRWGEKPSSNRRPPRGFFGGKR